MKAVIGVRRPRLDIIPSAIARTQARRGAGKLTRIMRIFGLNKSETGRLFGVTRQAVDDWYLKGVPLARLADIGRIADLALALHGRFQPDRLPQIARSPLPGLEDRSILTVIAQEGTGPVFDLLDRAFSYTP